MNKLPLAKKVAVISALVEGCSVRSTSRLTGVAKGTILRLLAEVGKACVEYQERVLHNIPAKRIQVDEIWSFVGCKEKSVTAEKLEREGLVGERNAGFATDFLRDVAARVSNRVQLTTDAHKMYLIGVPSGFRGDVDYAQLIKVYGTDSEGHKRYSPAQCLGTKRENIVGFPDPRFVSTSYVERQNLTMRMNIRRFTRLTNAFSKKLENHMHAVALFYMHYNFCRINQTLRVTPAMEAGISQNVWTIHEIVSLTESRLIKAA
jgi:hypothetical protein